MNRVFITYARPDQKLALKLYEDLKSKGLRPWIDVVDLGPGVKWKSTIQKQIRNTDYVVVLLSSESLNRRGFVQKEINVALEVLEEQPSDRIFLLPARIEECLPKDERLLELQWVDLFPEYAAGLERLVGVVRSGHQMPRFYSEVGLDIPSDLCQRSGPEQHAYFRNKLWPELLTRALRSYEGIELSDRQGTLRAEAMALGDRTAAAHGFLVEWRRFIGERAEVD